MSKIKEIKSEKKRKPFTYNKIVIILIIFLALAAISNILCVIFIVTADTLNQMSSSEKIEASFLSTGFNVIIIIITIWAGLNIVNAITKNDLEDIADKVKKIDNEIDDMNAHIDSLKMKLAKNEVLKYLIRDSDIPSKRIYDIIDNTEISAEEAEVLLKIEIDYSLINELHDSSLKDNKELIEKACVLKSTIDNFMEKYSHNNDIILYCKYRLASILFYMGYDEPLLVDKYKSFDQAQKMYLECAQLLNIELPFYLNYYKPKNKDFRFSSFSFTEIDCSENDAMLKVFFSNVIGESNSKILHTYIMGIDKLSNKNKGNDNNHDAITLCSMIGKPLIEDYVNKALFYCSFAAWTARNTKYNEVYFRNKGCAYERASMINNRKFEYAEIIINCYLEAFNRSLNDNSIKTYRVRNIYFCLLNYYDKILCQCFDSNGVHPRIKGMLPDCLYNYWHFSKKAILEFPRHTDFYIFRSNLIKFIIENYDIIEHISDGKLPIQRNEIIIEADNLLYNLAIIGFSDTEIYDSLKEYKNKFMIKIKENEL